MALKTHIRPMAATRTLCWPVAPAQPQRLGQWQKPIQQQAHTSNHLPKLQNTAVAASTKQPSTATIGIRLPQRHQPVALAAITMDDEQEQRGQWVINAAIAVAAGALVLRALLLYPATPSYDKDALPIIPSPQALSDVVRSDYAFLGRAGGRAGADGDLLTPGDLAFVDRVIWSRWAEGAPQVGDGRPGLAYRLFDLNQDGAVTKEEALRSLALEAATHDATGTTARAVFTAFDADGNGRVDAAEWDAGLGDLGPSGAPLKRFIFERADLLSGSRGRLGAGAFGPALGLAREAAIGGGAGGGPGCVGAVRGLGSL